MITDFYWLIENEIAGMAMPSALRAFIHLGDAEQAAQEELQAEANELRERNIGGLVSLTEEALPTGAYEQAGIQYLHLPVPDMTAPTPSQIDDFVSFAQTEVEQGKAVAVHCLGGSGRTGTILACYLVSKGEEPEQAIRKVRQIRPTAIETQWQIEAIHWYADQGSRLDF